MSVEEIGKELDKCFEELGYKDNEYPFEHGWREDGVPGKMVVQFAKRQAAAGKPLKCFIFHRGHKISEYVPQNADCHISFCSSVKILSSAGILKKAASKSHAGSQRLRSLY